MIEVMIITEVIVMIIMIMKITVREKLMANTMRNHGSNDMNYKSCLQLNNYHADNGNYNSRSNHLVIVMIVVIEYLELTKVVF